MVSSLLVLLQGAVQKQRRAEETLLSAEETLLSAEETLLSAEEARLLDLWNDVKVLCLLQRSTDGFGCLVSKT